MSTLVGITDTIGTTIETTNLKATAISTSPVIMIAQILIPQPPTLKL